MVVGNETITEANDRVELLNLLKVPKNLLDKEKLVILDCDYDVYQLRKAEDVLRYHKYITEGSELFCNNAAWEIIEKKMKNERSN